MSTPPSLHRPQEAHLKGHMLTGHVPYKEHLLIPDRRWQEYCDPSAGAPSSARMPGGPRDVTWEADRGAIGLLQVGSPV